MPIHAHWCMHRHIFGPTSVVHAIFDMVTCYAFIIDSIASEVTTCFLLPQLVQYLRSPRYNIGRRIASRAVYSKPARLPKWTNVATRCVNKPSTNGGVPNHSGHGAWCYSRLLAPPIRPTYYMEQVCGLRQWHWTHIGAYVGLISFRDTIERWLWASQKSQSS